MSEGHLALAYSLKSGEDPKCLSQRGISSASSQLGQPSALVSPQTRAETVIKVTALVSLMGIRVNSQAGQRSVLFPPSTLLSVGTLRTSCSMEMARWTDIWRHVQ